MQPHWMNRCSKLAPDGGLINDPLTGKDIDTQSRANLSVEQGSFCT